MKNLTTGFKLFLALIIGTGVYFGINYLKTTDFGKNILTAKDVKQTQLIQSNFVVLPDAPKNSEGQNVTPAEMPSDVTSNINSKPINIEVMAWNSQMGMMFANGGINTTKGSLMEKSGVNVNIKRQDDCNQMQTNLIKFANDYKNNPNTATGTNFIAIMGDGAAAWLAGANTELEKLGTEYRAQIIYSMGKSLGEDKFMAPQIVKENPQNAKGLVCSAYLRDGDWNIVIKWCADNNIPVNTDEKTYDPEAMNFVSASDFIDAAQKYVTGYKEERLVVKTVNGVTKKTGDKKTVEVNCTTTWTPGDVIVAENKGGLVSIVSTAEYRSQMPNVLIGISKYMQDNRNQIESMLTAIGQGGDQVKTYDAALQKAGEISAKVYNEKDAAYWVKYYKGTQQVDKQGLIVSLGGSRVHNLADNIELFGLNQGGTNVYASVYKVFGDIVSNLYPELVPSYPQFTDVVDFSYINNVKNKNGQNITTADKMVYNSDTEIKETVSKRAWSIEFQSGSAEFTPKALNTLDELYNQLTVANGLSVEIFGHTDNTGNAENNVVLSQQRALAVKNWLESKSRTVFPESRFAKVIGKGQYEPVADNSTQVGRGKNRRVEILMGK
jgi:outer membrane protein OmpA-like peptidoglycan-associated protein